MRLTSSSGRTFICTLPSVYLQSIKASTESAKAFEHVVAGPSKREARL